MFHWPASATCLVTYDKDLLSLEQSFGIEIIRPPEFLRRIKSDELCKLKN
jgi:predicted nucleic acid-binding protein